MSKIKKKNGKKNKITPRNRKFIENYVNCGNQTRAYIDAGYSKNGAQASAAKLLENPIIFQEVERRRKEIAEQNDVTASKIITELSKIAFLKSSDVFNYSQEVIETTEGDKKISVAHLKPQEELSDAALSSICSIKETKQGLEIKLYDKQKALDTLARYVGLDNDANIDKARRIKQDEKSQEITDPLEGKTAEEIQEEIDKLG